MLSGAESYLKAGGAYLVGVAGGSFINAFVLGYIIGQLEQADGGWSGVGPGQFLLNALIETSLFLVFSGLVGSRMSAGSQLLFTIGLFSNNKAIAAGFGSVFGTWVYGKL